jgi:APA family basic amino acid/polyamine antiporter
MLPEAGGSYVYVREAFGPLPAFLLGWTLFLAIGSGSIATLAVAFGNYAAELVPVGPVTRKLLALGVIAAVTVVNIRGTRHAANVQNWSTAIKVGAILALSAAGFVLGQGLGQTGPRLFTTPLSGGVISGVGVALLGVLWAYEGWQNVTYSAGEAIDPQRTFSRGIVIGTIGLIAIYLIANVGYLAALGPDGVESSDRVAADAVRTLAGPAAAKVITAAVLVSMFSAANGVTLTDTRCYFAMARDGVFFRKLAEVHPRFGTPAFAILTSAAWAMLLTFGTFEQLLTYVVFASWLFAALAAASVFVLRRRRPDAPRPFRVPGYPLTPALFIAAAVTIIVNTFVARPLQAVAGIGIVLLGTPVYLFWKRAAGATDRL